MLTAVAAVPGEEGRSLLATLARAHKDIADDHTWIREILGRGTLKSCSWTWTYSSNAYWAMNATVSTRRILVRRSWNADKGFPN